MKQVIYIFLLGLVLQGCWRQYPAITASDKLINVPTPPHRNEVHVFLPGEELPKRPYLKIKVISVDDYYYITDNDLIRQLIYEARMEGLDDVILLDKSVTSETVTETVSPGLLESIADLIIMTNDPDYEPTPEETVSVTYNRTQLTAMGIKYIDNMDYIRDMIKTEYVHVYNPTDASFDLAGYVTFKLTGETERRVDDQGLIKFFEDHSLDHLVYDESKNWRYKPLRETLIRRKLYRFGVLYKKCDIRLNQYNLIEKIDLEVFGEEPAKESIEYFYNQDHRLTGRILRTKRFPYLREKRIFKSDGGWKEFIYFDENGDVLMRRKWDCFEERDLREYANNSH